MKAQTINFDYDSVSPITNNRCVVEEANPKDNTTSYLCMESGFTSHEHLKDGSDFQKKYESAITELMADCKFLDNGDRAWYPTFMQMPGAMLYVDGTSKSDWHWKVAKTVAIVGEERLKYPIMGKLGEYYTSRLDTENALKFTRDDFKAALDEFYSSVKKVYENENKLRDNSVQ